MRRREFIALISGAAMGPIAGRAQPRGAVARVGVLMGIADGPEGQTRVAAFRKGLEELGWTEGQNVEVVYRWSGGEPEVIRRDAAELVAMRPDVLMANTFTSLAVLRNETRAIPIVFVMVSDPVGTGLVASMTRPGGNITGFTPFEPSLGGKWLELLKDIVPRLARVDVLFNPDTAPNAQAFLESAGTAASALRMSLNQAPVRSDAEIERAIAERAQEPASGLIIVPDVFTAARFRLIVAAAARVRVPVIAPYRYFTTAGGIASYGVNIADEHRRAAVYIHRILRGEKPSALPVQLPTRFELVINLKTARALGLDVPPTLLARADEVIE